MTPIALVVAVARNGVIGRDGDLPWRIPSDLKHFKAVTLGKPVVMGRRTWDSLPRKPLPGRVNIVVSRSLPDVEGARVARDLDAALALADEVARREGAEEICVIGGAQIYAACLAKAARLYLTEVDLEPQGDALFPTLDPAHWREASAQRFDPAPGDEAGFTARILERR
ncbi:dihydrofolate reductase [Alkalicaulis satelles]|uniref:Dihydrofolate reductase n=1 Tax=Alkalicaulis satelles TaxID=2609175 RepID=A0A5M6ZIG0_9PROT|nr:dihydrofolate reductase [Alkalicaulis satelles]KAA5804622.1 dihydrofolate reductase [Alkalicaulis satelles]